MNNAALLNQLLAQGQIALEPAPFLNRAPSPLPEDWDFERVEGMLKNYPFVTPETLAYFTARPQQARADSEFALAYVKQHARTAEQQQAVLGALEFKCNVLWAMCDALYHAYVDPKAVPPGAFVPGDA